MIKTTSFFSHVFGFIGSGGGMGASYFHGQPGSAGASSPVESYASLIAAHEPIHYWELNEAAGVTSAIPTIGGEYASAIGNASAGYSTMVSSTGDTSWNFDGTNSYLSFGERALGDSLHGASVLTIEAWVDMNVLGVNDGLFVTYVGENAAIDRFGLSLDCTVANTLRFGARSKASDTLRTVTHVVSAGELDRPLYVVGVANFQNDQMSLWFDGVKVVGSTAAVFASSVYTYASANLNSAEAIGAMPASNRWLNGKVGHMAIYATALSSAKIASHYREGKGAIDYYQDRVLQDNPVLYYPFQSSAFASSIYNFEASSVSTTWSAINTPTFGASSLVTNTNPVYEAYNVHLNDGSSEYFRMNPASTRVGATLAGASAVTYELWCYVSAISGTDDLMLVWNGNNTALRVWLTGSQFNVVTRSKQTDGNNIQTVSAAAGNTYHLGIVADFENDVVRVVVNGSTEVSAAATYSTSIFAYTTAAHTAFDSFGGYPANGTYFDGRVGHLAMYRSALSASTLVDHYNAGTYT